MQTPPISWRHLKVVVPLLLLLLLFLKSSVPPDTSSPDQAGAEDQGSAPMIPMDEPADALPAEDAPTIIVNGMEILANEPPPIVRGKHKRLFYPEAVVEQRDPVRGTVFAESILRARGGPLVGPLTMDEHTSSAIEASFDHRAVWRFVESEAEFIKVPLAAGQDILVQVEKVVHRGERTHTLLGKVKDAPLSDVLLVFHDGAVSGSVAFMGRGEHFQYEMAGNGDVAIRHLDGASYTALCGDPGAPPAEQLDGSVPDGAEVPEGDPAEEPPAGAMVMDTVIGYGAQARAAQGGTSAMEAKVLQGIDRLNTAMNNSLVADSFVSLVATLEDPDYVFPGAVSGSMSSGDELGDLNATSASNPELNTISDLRILLGADHNGFVIKQADGSAGVAYRPGKSMLVGRTYISSTRITFAHEFGHNVGCQHSWGDSSSDSNTSVYRYGWRLDPPSSTRVRTIMAYDWGWGSGHRIPYFANPLVEFNSARTGQANGYDATGDSESDSRYVSGGLTGTAGTGFDGTNGSLGARNADYFEERDQFLGDNATRTALAVIDPTSGESWPRGSTQTIFWYGGDQSDSTQLDLYKGGVFQNTIASGFDAHLRWYQWGIPSGQTVGTDYTIRLTLNGSTIANSQTFAIQDSNTAPTDLALSASAINENVPLGTTVGTLSTTDLEGGPFTYTLVSGSGSTDNLFFNIIGASLQTAAAINYEFKSSLDLRIRSTDPGGAFYEEAFTIAVNNLTEVPTTPKLVRNVLPGITNDSWTLVNLGQTYASPVVIATPIYPDGPLVPMVARVRNASGSSCEVRIARVDGLTGTVSCDLSIIAVEEGVYNSVEHGVTMEAATFTSTLTAENGNWIGESRSYQNIYASPVVVGQVMTAVDPDWSVFWCRGSSRENPPDPANLVVGKTVCEDPDAVRADETIGYLVLEAGNGTIEGLAYTAGVGADLVQGYGDSPTGYPYPITGLTSANAAAVACAGMDGADGGWAVLFGSNSLTSNSLNLIIAEDLLNDSEIAHTNEQVAYLVIEGVLNTAPTDIALSPSAVAENESAGTTVGSLSTTDAEGGPFTYALVSGSGSSDNGSFTISGSSLQTAAVFDFETKSSYAIRVRSTDPGNRQTEKQFTVTVTDVLEPPTAPDSLLATGGSGEISLSWGDNSNNETGFQIERSTTGGGVGFSLIHTTAAATTNYVDSDLPDGTTYHYRVLATNGAGGSAPSNEADATTFSTLEAWRLLHALASDGSEDALDSDGDGLSALMEFALGLDPTVKDLTNHPQSSAVEGGGSTYLTLTFRRRIGGSIVSNAWQVDGITCRVEVGDDMQAANWDSDATKVEWGNLPIDNGDGTETIVCRLKTPVDTAGPQYFIRLGVEETP